MRSIISVIAIAGLATAFSAVFMSTNAESAKIATFAPAMTPAPEVEVSDVQRRASLEARLQNMVQAGQGGRLTDVSVRHAIQAAPRRPATPASSSSSVKTASSAVSDRVDVSTIAPPEYRGGDVWRSSGRYIAPTLDLVSKPNIPTDDVECLTQAIYYEARNESEEGQAAVAEVVLNRARSGAYPRKVCEVVYQRNSRTCQFTFTCDGSIGRRPVAMAAWARAERIARDVYEGRSQAKLPRNSVNYHANYVRPTWGARLQRVRQIGAHIFYGAALNGGATPGAERDFERETATRGLIFVRNEALDRTYASLQAGGAQTGAAP